MNLIILYIIYLILSMCKNQVILMILKVRGTSSVAAKGYAKECANLEEGDGGEPARLDAYFYGSSSYEPQTNFRCGEEMSVCAYHDSTVVIEDEHAVRDEGILRLQLSTYTPREAPISGIAPPSDWNGAASCIPDGTAAGATGHDHVDQHDRGTLDSEDVTKDNSCGDDVQRLLNAVLHGVRRDPVPACDNVVVDELLWRRKQKAIRRKARRKSGKSSRSGDPENRAEEAKAAEVANVAVEAKLSKPAKEAKARHRGEEPVSEEDDSDNMVFTVSSNRLRLTKQSTSDDSLPNVDSCSPACVPAAVTVYTAKVGGHRDRTKRSAKYIDVVMDTGSDGHLLPTSVMTEVKETAEGTYCGGVGQGREPLTHIGYVESLKGRAYAPTNDTYLMSMSMLDKAGCIYVGGGGMLKVSDRNGNFMLKAVSCQIICIYTSCQYHSVTMESAK